MDNQDQVKASKYVNYDDSSQHANEAPAIL